MELDNVTKQAVQKLGEAINQAISDSFRVKQAIEHLHELGYNPNLIFKLEIGLQDIDKSLDDEFPEDIVLDLTDEDLRTLESMRIKTDDIE
ncbi:MAG: hypothetical protein MUC29_07610 [Pyrinomonadaceae bacterium]|jgi:hypothetical protein|nr:hypothetical protein [Pyrinomonadaceae bacterium]